jgi:drug/metabolite transporter (DMT)-like permease
VLLLVDSLHFVFARLLEPLLPPEAAAFYVLAVASLETGLFLGARREIRPAVFWRHAPFFLVVGLLVAASTALNYAAVHVVDPGTASLLGKTSIVFSLALGFFWLRERLVAAQVVGAAVALAGAAAISFQPGAPADFLRAGSLFILASSFMYALHAAIVKGHGQEIDFANFFFFRVASTTAFLWLIVAGRGNLVWPGPRAWLFLALAGTVDVVISRVLYYLALRRLQMSFHTILLTLSPVITIGWSLLLFGAYPGVRAILGGVAVIAGVAIVTVYRPESRAARQPLPAGSSD